mgnify:CR=1 FL=1
MSLINQSYRKSWFDSAVRSFHWIGIGSVESTFMLIDKYSVIFKSLETVAVKFLCEQSLAHAERIGWINNNKVIFIFLVAYKSQSVLIKNVYSWICKTAGGLRQILTTNFLQPFHQFQPYQYFFIWLYRVNSLTVPPSPAPITSTLVISGFTAIGIWVIISWYIYSSFSVTIKYPSRVSIRPNSFDSKISIRWYSLSALLKCLSTFMENFYVVGMIFRIPKFHYLSSTTFMFQFSYPVYRS